MSLIKDFFVQFFKNILKLIYRFLNRLTGGVFGIIVTAVRQFILLNSLESAASLAYYSLFSTLPLLIFLVVSGSFFLEGDQVQQQVTRWSAEFFPGITDFVGENLQLLVEQRGSASISAIIGLLWSGSGAFNALAHNINRAWPHSKPRNFFERRFVAIIMVLALVTLLFTSLVLTTLVSILPLVRYLVPLQPVIENALWGEFIAYLFSILLLFLMFWGMYRWLPNTHVTWFEAGWGAAVATIGWRWGINTFTWFLSSGLGNFQVLYGTLGTVIAFMVWIYISSAITLFGAHISAAIAKHRRVIKIVSSQSLDDNEIPQDIDNYID